MRTIKGTRREEIEMIGNLSMFRSACFHLNDSTMDSQIRTFIEKVSFSRGYCTPSMNTVKTMHSLDAIDRIYNLFPKKNIRFFSSCKVGRIR